jgi:Uma2 family endonuclease
MNAEEFEQLAVGAPDTVRLEFVAGRLVVKAHRDGDHSEIVAWLIHYFARYGPRHWLYDGRGLRAGASLGDRVRPDGVLAPRRHFTGHGEWSNPDGVLMTVEVTSRDAESNSRARVAKRESYAAADIPVYLLIDRDNCSVTVTASPAKAPTDTRSLPHTAKIYGSLTLSTLPCGRSDLWTSPAERFSRTDLAASGPVGRQQARPGTH